MTPDERDLLIEAGWEPMPTMWRNIGPYYPFGRFTEEEALEIERRRQESARTTVAEPTDGAV